MPLGLNLETQAILFSDNHGLSYCQGLFHICDNHSGEFIAVINNVLHHLNVSQ